MAISEEFRDLPPEMDRFEDPSARYFRFNDSDRQKMLDEGMTEDQILAREIEITNEMNRKAA